MNEITCEISIQRKQLSGDLSISRKEIQGDLPGDLIFGVPGKSAYQYAVEAGYTGTEEEFAEKLASNGEVQPDWEATEAEPGHVLNRTHYIDYTVLLPKTTLELEQSSPDSNPHMSLPCKLGLEVGMRYKVIYNGTAYICTAREESIPSGHLVVYIGSTIKTDEFPFKISEYKEYSSNSWVDLYDSPSMCVLTVIARFGAIKKIPEKFLPTPKSLTINGTSYNGSKEVNITIEDGLPDPTPETAGKSVVVNESGDGFTLGEAVGGGSIDDMEQLAMLAEMDMLPTIQNADGSILTDANGTIILRY